MESNPCGAGKPPPKWRWLEGDEELVGEDKRYKVIGTAFIDSPGLDAPLRGQYLCQDEDWASMNPIYPQEVQPLPPGRELELYWQVEIRRYGFGGSVSGWRSSDVTLEVNPIGEYFTNWEGNQSISTEIVEIAQNGTSKVLATGYDGRVYVAKSRYRDNGGPWQSFLDYSSLL
jgi:hypothetical protein